MTNSQKEPKLLYRETEEIQQILGRPPGWLLRWGATLVLGATILLLLLAWLYRYPDVVTTPVELRTARPPLRLTAPVSAPVAELWVTDGEEVDSGRLLLALAGSVNRADAQQLQAALQAFLAGETQEFPTSNRLGELQGAFAELLREREAQREWRTRADWAARLANLQEQKQQLEALYASLRRQDTTLVQELHIARSNSDQYRQLLARGAASELEYEAAQTEYLRYRRELESLRSRQLQNRLDKTRLDQAITTLRQERRETAAAFETRIREKARALYGRLSAWEEKHLLRAPFAGRVAFTGLEDAQEFARAGEALLTLVPTEQPKVVGQAQLPSSGLGKVQPGAEVQIRLDAYPYQEFGVLKGTVEKITLAPSRPAEHAPYYRLSISLNQGMQTSAGRTLDFRQEMSGEARVITSSRSLLERLIRRLLTAGSGTS